MARKKKDTWFQELATQGANRALIKLSQAGKLPEVKPGNFPAFQVYACKDSSVGNLTCDVACVVGKTMAEKQTMAETIVQILNEMWANNPFKAIHTTGNGFIHFQLPEGVSL